MCWPLTLLQQDQARCPGWERAVQDPALPRDACTTLGVFLSTCSRDTEMQWLGLLCIRATRRTGLEHNVGHPGTRDPPGPQKPMSGCWLRPALRAPHSAVGDVQLQS